MLLARTLLSLRENPIGNWKGFNGKSTLLKVYLGWESDRELKVSIMNHNLITFMWESDRELKEIYNKVSIYELLEMVIWPYLSNFNSLTDSHRYSAASFFILFLNFNSLTDSHCQQKPPQPICWGLDFNSLTDSHYTLFWSVIVSICQISIP